MSRESMCTAGEARTHGACVTSVLCTRVLVCKAQSSERGRGSGEAEAGKPVRDTRNRKKSRNREIGKMRAACIGIGKSRRRVRLFLRAGVVLVRRRCYTLAGLPLSSTRSPVLTSQRAALEEPPPFTELWLVLSQAQISGLGLLQCKCVQYIQRPHGVKRNLTRRKKSALARSSWLKSRSQSMTQQQQPLFQILHGNLQAHIYLQHQMRTPLVHKARHRPHMQQATRSRPCQHGIQCGHLATTHVTRATPSRRRCIGSRGS